MQNGFELKVDGFILLSAINWEENLSPFSRSKFSFVTMTGSLNIMYNISVIFGKGVIWRRFHQWRSRLYKTWNEWILLSTVIAEFSNEFVYR